MVNWLVKGQAESKLGGKMSFQKIMKIFGSGSKMLMLCLSYRVRESREEKNKKNLTKIPPF